MKGESVNKATLMIMMGMALCYLAGCGKQESSDESAPAPKVAASPTPKAPEQPAPEEAKPAPKTPEQLAIEARDDARDLLYRMWKMLPVPGKTFRMGRYEVLQGDWQEVMYENPSYFQKANKESWKWELTNGGELHPVENVSYEDCENFIRRLNKLALVSRAEVVFRLPTEEEWEYCCRAGSIGDWGRLEDGSEDGPIGRIAWYSRNAQDQTHCVGQKKPNAWEFFDMHGNVWEWTSTAESGNRVCRGGGWHNTSEGCTAGNRVAVSPDTRGRDLGLRLVCETDKMKEEQRKRAEEARKTLLTNAGVIPGRKYKIGKTEVTQAQWESVMGTNPSEFEGGDRPVENVSWNDVQEFIEKLNNSPDVQEAKVKFRLPTEEEWEHACRAGGKGDWGKRANGEEGPLDVMGWFSDNSGGETHSVAQKEPNAWGLYDMHGNVAEWTSTAVGDKRVTRGGCWELNSNFSTAGDLVSRFRRDPGARDSNLGFRLVSEDL